MSEGCSHHKNCNRKDSIWKNLYQPTYHVPKVHVRVCVQIIIPPHTFKYRDGFSFPC